MSVILPKPDKPFGGKIGVTTSDSTPEKPVIQKPPEGAPNVVVVLLDDVGFGAAGTFGGPVPTPVLDALARQGLRYNQFHTTALCSPTRAALLTGRNHHSVGMGAICEIGTGYPGYSSVIPRSAATVAEVLRLNGYNTAMFGKNHLTPMWETSPGGPFDRWPTGLGFERFYGFMGGEASQWEPALFDQTTPIEAHAGKENYHLTEDLADQCIKWIRNQNASAPDKPFMVYFATGACHSPLQAPKEWIDRLKGQFGQGWDKLREETLERQLKLGVVPAGTRLTPRPAEIPSWEEYPDRYKPMASRLMELWAGFLAHTDAQIGRLVEAIQDLDVWDNTLFIYIVGDNGTSGEGTIHGAWSCPAYQNGVSEDPEWLLAHMGDFGTVRCENHFNVGWAWALDSPFQWMKQIASHFGGTRNGVVMSWPKRILDHGGLRSQFHHVIDIMPTILEAAGIPHPDVVNGTPQKPVEGVSMVYSFDNPNSPSRHHTQYFEVLGNRGLYHEGWIASCFHGRVPWIRSQTLPFDGPNENWELYHVAEDFSQGEDVAALHPQKLKELRDLFDKECRKYHVYPLDDNTTARAVPGNRPSLVEGRTKFTYYRDNVRMPELSVVNLKNTSFELVAELEIPKDGAQGVVICQGGNMAGWSLYVANNRPAYAYNWLGHELYTIAGYEPLPSGKISLRLVFDYDGGGLGKGGSARLTVNGRFAAEGRIEKTVPFLFSMSGETLDVGQDTGTPVGPYEAGFPFTGTIYKIEIEVKPALDAEAKQAAVEGELVGALRAQ